MALLSYVMDKGISMCTNGERIHVIPYHLIEICFNICFLPDRQRESGCTETSRRSRTLSMLPGSRCRFV